MRTPKLEKRRQDKPKCAVCKQSKSIDEVPNVIFKISPGYSGRITRSITKILDYISEFILVEIYRCMPLLGDEENVPNWEIHIVKYAIVFTKDIK